MKIKFFFGILISALIAIFFFSKRNTSKEGTVLFYNSIPGIISDSTATGKEKELLELCKIWGAIKYHSSDRDFIRSSDASLIKAYEKIMAGKADLNLLISRDFQLPAHNPSSPSYSGFLPDKNWIETSGIINPENKKKLVEFLATSYRNSDERLVTAEDNGELSFEDDSLFYDESKTTPAKRFLSLCKLWNITRYYYPYFQSISSTWNEVFFKMLPLFINAKNEQAYYAAVQQFGSRLKDSHVAVKMGDSDEYDGKYVGNAVLKTIEEQTFIKGFIIGSVQSALKKGDEILAINGKDILSVQDSLKEKTSGSNDVVLSRDINRLLLLSRKKTVQLDIVRQNRMMRIQEHLTHINTARETEEKEYKSNAGKAVSKMIDKNIGYIRINDIFSGNFRISFEKISHSKAIIFDLRAYPNEIAVDFLKYFDTRPFQTMNLYRADVTYPGMMRTIENKMHIPDSKKDAYRGPVVLLINEYTQSQGESILLAMKSIKNSVTLGDYTAGTNGNVMVIRLPGKTKIRMSGIGVLLPDYSATQRTGIRPDILVQEDAASLLSGEDIQLKEAINYINKKL
ncbi:S41 family peptidase [Chryseobacterium herbae]|uniref:S41 family peptidase n=1 Tax=Chryseobacterium herbae TaxID=2976476 RepID=A0ABT2INS1_9FLAO|nr:S41 family peptidase [Chryseobacterium sp. pc1-10]MCT2560467.1 S41 family peptidase [Chryseobacterium sp. pc1-10]